MTGLFGALYAGAYDALYASKDYAGEVELLESLFATHATRPVRSVLDLGCGTGRHAAILGSRGYRVVGVDRSNEMLAIAGRRAAGLPAGRVRFRRGDIRSIRLAERFDAVVLMFNVLGYQVTDADALRTVGTARRHLEPGGLFACDVWYALL